MTEEQDNFNEAEALEQLQDKIRKMSEEDDNQPAQEESANPMSSAPERSTTPAEQTDEADEPTPKGSAQKKYVILANPENVEFLEQLSPDERNEVFNEILSDYVQNEPVKRGRKRLLTFLIHILIVSVTALIVFPLAFFVVNKSVELTIKNYRGTQENFEKLYETHGIK